jgi:hypothetical protein
MKEVKDCWCIQIDVTNACERQCSNCTHLVKCAKPWFMDMETFKRAVDSLEGFPNIIGVIGGNPVLHPDFAKMVEYVKEKIPHRQRGMWVSTMGKNNQYEKLIWETFPVVLYNDHLRSNWHQPVLVASQDVIPDPAERAEYIRNCWVAEHWSPSISPKGCYRCEIMAAFDMALNLNIGLPIEPGWWKRPLSDFQKQIDVLCQRCGSCVPMWRRRDADHIDDISPSNLDIAVPSRSRLFDRKSYSPENILNWFPCNYRIGNEKPWGITVSVGYSGCLERTLPFNLRHLERMIVVTSPADEKTKAVCSKYPNDVIVVETDLFYKFGAVFNKGAGMEMALWMIPKDKWCLILDADICLPCDVCQLEWMDRNKLYGASRALVATEEQLQKATRRRNFDVTGLEVISSEMVGAFQLFHPQADVLQSNRPWYGINYNNASMCDNAFTVKWPTDRHVMLPVMVLHLGHQYNWVGAAEGTFPRPDTTPKSAVNSCDPLPIPVEQIQQAIMDELKTPKIVVSV